MRYASRMKFIPPSPGHSTYTDLYGVSTDLNIFLNNIGMQCSKTYPHVFDLSEYECRSHMNDMINAFREELHEQPYYAFDVIRENDQVIFYPFFTEYGQHIWDHLKTGMGYNIEKDCALPLRDVLLYMSSRIPLVARILKQGGDRRQNIIERINPDLIDAIRIIPTLMKLSGNDIITVIKENC